ncbi:MAG: hypothetical protein O2800_05330 [Planctomycetota bacterium]|nr:hypothetical protein [Planctomycetota bacterium]
MEFLTADEAATQLRAAGIEVIEDDGSIQRFGLADDERLTAIDIAASDHPQCGRLSPEVIRIDRQRIAPMIEAIVHKLHLPELLGIPMGRWRNIIDAVSEPLKDNKHWTSVDSELGLEVNTRDALVFSQSDHRLLRDLADAIVMNGTSPAQGMAFAPTGSPLLIELLPAGELVIWVHHAALAIQVREIIAHVVAAK